MKKILSLVLVLALMLSFVSCTKKADYFEDNLKDAGYDVEVLDDEDDLKEWVAEMTEQLDIDLKGDVKYVLEAYLEDDESYEYISIYCFEKLADAKTIEESAIDSLDEDDDTVVERKGKLVIYATSNDAIDAAYGK